MTGGPPCAHRGRDGVGGRDGDSHEQKLGETGNLCFLSAPERTRPADTSVRTSGLLSSEESVSVSADLSVVLSDNPRRLTSPPAGTENRWGGSNGPAPPSCGGAVNVPVGHARPEEGFPRSGPGEDRGGRRGWAGKPHVLPHLWLVLMERSLRGWHPAGRPCSALSGYNLIPSHCRTPPENDCC